MKNQCSRKPVVFNADAVRSELQKEIDGIQKAIEERNKKELQLQKKAIKNRIDAIPGIMKGSLKNIASNRLPSRVIVLRSVDTSMVKSITSQAPNGRELILEFLAVKEILKWAKKRKFGYEINITNGYWELYLTW